MVTNWWSIIIHMIGIFLGMFQLYLMVEGIVFNAKNSRGMNADDETRVINTTVSYLKYS